MSEGATKSVTIAGAAMVKDECDIIELFVRINSRHLDHLFIVDHCSNDPTREILARLMAEGYPLTVYAYNDHDFQQSKVITWLVQQIAATGSYDYIIPLDADEFLYPKSCSFAESICSSVPQGKCGHIKWESFVPISENYYEEGTAPLYDCFRKRSHENPQFYKVIISQEVALSCTVTEGNHFVVSGGQMMEYLPVDSSVLRHVPVRSSEQLVAKALIGNHRLSIKVGRGKAETTHWDDIALIIRNNNYRLAHDDVMKVALEYASDGGNFVDGQPALEEDDRIGTQEDRICYLDMARVDLNCRFDVFAGSLCREILQLRED